MNFTKFKENFFKKMKTLKIIGTKEEITIGKIFCLGRNYIEHVKEMKSDIPIQPIIFLKPQSAIIHDGEMIIKPKISNELHHEVELVVAISKKGKHIQKNDAFNYILGYAIGLDMTLRDLQSEAKKKGLPWTLAKGFDTSAPVSDIIPADKIQNPHNLTISCSVNGVIRQKSSTSKMIFTIDDIIEYVSSIFTIERGDLIFTGTPEGVGEVRPGERITAEIENHISISHLIGSE